ncbi:bifunctional purine biosynthesis protein purH [Lipomyces arxii]|uniref:bifunctional purine biosynthesis protein purH n=1 Tax=Lipomyces arxii TaxID=56418 RepID=UPI0034CDC1C5
MSMRLTASLSSRINRSQKRRREDGSDVLYAAEAEHGGDQTPVPQPSKRAREAKLEITNLIVSIEGEMSRLSDINIGISVVLSRMWEPIPEKGIGLSRDGMADLYRFRKTIPPLIMVSHLHALFPSDPTFIDREVQRVAEEGIVRRMVVNQTAGDMVIENKEYLSRLHQAKQANSAHRDVFDKFEQLLKDKPASTQLTFTELTNYEISEQSGIRDLIAAGFLVLSGSPGIYFISIPNVGSFLKLSFRTRQWVVSLLSKTKWKEMMEKMIRERWDANHKKWREFRGVRFEWVMMEVKGGGWCEPFGTPSGRGWKLTGKKK